MRSYQSHFAVEETEEGKAKTCWVGGRHDRDYPGRAGVRLTSEGKVVGTSPR